MVTKFTTKLSESFGDKLIKNTHYKIRSSIINRQLLINRRAEIVLKSTKLFIQKGYDRTSVEELARAMGMTKAGLYRYIGSKDDILKLILEFMNLRVEEAKEFEIKNEELPPRQFLIDAMVALYKGIDQVHDVQNFINHVMINLSPEERNKVYQEETYLINYFLRIINRGIEAGEFSPDDPVFVANLILVNGNSWANRHWFLKRHYTLKKYTEQNIKTVLELLHAKGSA